RVYGGTAISDHAVQVATECRPFRRRTTGEEHRATIAARDHTSSTVGAGGGCRDGGDFDCGGARAPPCKLEGRISCECLARTKNTALFDPYVCRTASGWTRWRPRKA